MIRRPPRSTRTYTRFPYTTLFRSYLESVEVDAGIVDPDLLRIDAHARHRPAHRVRHREQPGGIVGGALHHLPRAPARAPIMDVRAARLHRLGNAEGAGQALRSEEHTSELQSLMRISYAVFCLKK